MRRTRAFLAVLALSATAAAEDLFVGSSNTTFWRGDPVDGEFQVVGACGGSIQSMDSDLGDVYLGDVLGRIYHYDPDVGSPVYAFDAPNDATALIVRGGALWIGGSDGMVHEVDKRDGTLLRSFDALFPVGALLVHDGFLYAGSTQGFISRVETGGGDLGSWGICSGPVNSLAADGTHLIAADVNGVVYRIAFATQAVESTYVLQSDATAMAMHAGDLLVAGTNGFVLRVDPLDGTVLGSLAVSLDLQAMVLGDAAEPGAPYCYGIACPCGNDDVLGGCANHQGAGATSHGSGSASAAVDDLVITMTGFPKHVWGVPYMGSVLNEVPFGDGILCTGGGYPVFRFPARNSGPTRTMVLGPGIVDHTHDHFGPGGRIQPGQTWVYQVWYRTPAGPCGNGFNTTNAYVVTFGP